MKERENKLTEAEKNMLEKISMRNAAPVLFAGHSKSGNTWLRFLIFNYFNIKNNGAEKTLTYSELNGKIQPDEIGALHIKTSEIKGTPAGYPDLIRTHQHHKEKYKLFKDVIYISRNPLDVLVSAYHFYITNRPENHSREYPHNEINSYVLFHLPVWLHHYKSYESQSRVLHVTYEELQRNTGETLGHVLRYMGCNNIDESSIEKSVKLSSFNSIKKMGRKFNEEYGMGPKERYKGEFTRKGKVGGYKDELKPETIKIAMKKLGPLRHNFELE